MIRTWVLSHRSEQFFNGTSARYRLFSAVIRANHSATVACTWCTYTSYTNRWRRGVVVSGVRRMNEVRPNARRALLVPGWVTVFGQVYHLGM